MPKSKQPKPAPGPDDIVRSGAGEYASGDGRFVVRQSDAAWYLVDAQQANEFGQELIHGPFRTLKEARSAMPGARSVKPLLRSQARPKRTGPKAAPPPRPKETWIDRLDPKEASEVRGLIRALEREGITSADDLVRSDRGGAIPRVTARLIELRLQQIIAAAPESDTERVRDAVEAAVAVLADQGSAPGRGLPGWAIFETGRGGEPTARRVRPQTPTTE